MSEFKKLYGKGFAVLASVFLAGIMTAFVGGIIAAFVQFAWNLTGHHDDGGIVEIVMGIVGLLVGPCFVGQVLEPTNASDKSHAVMTIYNAGYQRGQERVGNPEPTMPPIQLYELKGML